MNMDIVPSGSVVPSVSPGYLTRRDERKVSKVVRTSGRDLAVATAINQATAIEINDIGQLTQQAGQALAKTHYTYVVDLMQMVSQDVAAGRVPDWLAAEQLDLLLGFMNQVTAEAFENLGLMSRRQTEDALMRARRSYSRKFR